MAASTNPAIMCSATAVGKCPPLYRFSMFFDGTGNNMCNTLMYKNGKTQLSADSYLCDYSNVAKMFTCLDAADVANPDDARAHVKFYIEGIGTKTGYSDSNILGGGLGWSSDGIKTRVDETVILVVDKLNTVTKDKRAGLGSNKSLKVGLTFDVFGFSRGAAAARYFIYRMMVEGWVDESKKDSDAVIAAVLNKQIKQSGYNLEVSYIDVNFAGLFDTVAHYGGDEDDDVKQLHLDAIDKARHVVHLTAADEYRKNFSVVNVASVPKGNRVEVLLPGSHSDIGGGYKTSEDEDRWELSNSTVFPHTPNWYENDKKWLEKEGWYKSAEFEIVAPKETPRRLVASRAGIPNTYSQIPLRIMVDQATNKAGLKFQSSKCRDYIHPEWGSAEIILRESLPPDLQDLFTALYKPESPGLIGKWHDDFSYSDLRHKYLHFSSRYDVSDRWGLHFDIYAPRWIGDHRVRHIIPGFL